AQPGRSGGAGSGLGSARPETGASRPRMELEGAPGTELGSVFFRVLRPGNELHQDGLSLEAPVVPLVPQLDGDVRSAPVEQPEPVARIHLGQDRRGDYQPNLQPFGIGQDLDTDQRLSQRFAPSGKWFGITARAQVRPGRSV